MVDFVSLAEIRNEGNIFIHLNNTIPFQITMNSIMGGNRDKIQMANLILVYRGLKIEKNDEIYFILDIIKNRHNITDCPYFRSLRKEFPSLKPVHISKEISQTPLDVAPVFDRAKIKHVYMNTDDFAALKMFWV